MKLASYSTRLPTHAPLEYSAGLASAWTQVVAAQRLRFEVFNLELGEGLTESLATGLDADPYDEICDHLIVRHRATDAVVGTYRLQTGATAAAKRGYYSAEEFDLAAFEPARAEVIELGRACVHPRHRNLTVLGLLWKGIADYARARGGRYLCGCSSLTSQDPAAGASLYAELCRQHLAPHRWRVAPRPGYECALDQLLEEPPPIPKLLRAYLSIGAKICGPPALDRRFGTIDFFTWLDLDAVPDQVRLRFLA